MVKKTLMAMLVVALIASGIDLHLSRQREIDTQRAIWRKIDLELNVAHAGVVIPFPVPAATAVTAAWEMGAGLGSTLAPTVALGPLILAAAIGIGVGAGAYWLWTHGGAQALIIGTEAYEDGTLLTPAKIREKIANMNGINTNATPVNGLGGLGIIADGYTYAYSSVAVTSPGQPGNIGMPPVAYFYPNAVSATYFPGAYYIFIKSGTSKYNMYTINNSIPRQRVSSFNPADYPNLFGDNDAIKREAAKLAKANPGFNYNAKWMNPSDNNLPLNGAFSCPALNPVAQKTNNATGLKIIIDKDGRMWPDMGGLADHLNLPEAGGASQIKVGAESESVAVPESLAKALENAGIHGDVLDAYDNIVEWKDANGNINRTFVDPVTVGKLQKALPASLIAHGTGGGGGGGNGTVVNPMDTEADPGTPNGPGLRSLLPYDTSFDFGTEKELPVQSWIDSLPFVAVLRGSYIILSNPTSIYTYTYSVPNGRGGSIQQTYSFDFAKYEHILVGMGAIFYFLATVDALRRSICKNPS